MSLRHPLLSRWVSHPAEFLQGASMLKSSPSSPRSLMHHRPMMSSPASQVSFSRAFSLGRSLQFQGRSLGRVKNSTATSRPRIDPIKPPRHNKHQQQQQQRRRFTSSRENPASFSQRLRKLSKEYGWSALGVYLLLSAMDFPFCYAAVSFLGADRIGHYEDVILQTAGDAFRAVWPGKETGEESKPEGEEAAGEGDNVVKTEKSEEEVKKAAAKKKVEEASLWTKLALAYAIHKSLIFFRVPLTAAITPKVVKVLRAWGVDISKRRP